MTFSIVARDRDRFGIAASSSSPAVAARVAHLRPGVGAATSQNITDPRLGTALLDRLAAHGDAERALSEVVKAGENIEYRQLTVLGRTGAGFAYSGGHTLGTHAAATADGVVAAGNMLAGDHIPQVLVDAFTSATGELEQRLVTALQAAVDAGGEQGPVHSAGLVVVADIEWHVTDLRVDWADNPIDRLAELLDVWLPQRDDYVRRALDPATAPSYGVPGDSR
nr:major pilin protein fimA [Kibdelosporangium sp. MJ126-NF4]